MLVTTCRVLDFAADEDDSLFPQPVRHVSRVNPTSRPAAKVRVRRKRVLLECMDGDSFLAAALYGPVAEPAERY
uniref:Uncharacterized protein n=1 Tax=Bifidobacterium asteroides TaxID=1684 RepID=A0ABS3IRE7_9BIFI